MKSYAATVSGTVEENAVGGKQKWWATRRAMSPGICVGAVLGRGPVWAREEGKGQGEGGGEGGEEGKGGEWRGRKDVKGAGNGWTVSGLQKFEPLYSECAEVHT